MPLTLSHLIEQHQPAVAPEDKTEQTETTKEMRPKSPSILAKLLAPFKSGDKKVKEQKSPKKDKKKEEAPKKEDAPAATEVRRIHSYQHLLT